MKLLSKTKSMKPLRLENFHLDTYTNINILASGLMNSLTTQSPHEKFKILLIEL